MMFVVPPWDYHLGLKTFDHWTFQFEELDVVIYSIEKAFRLLLKCNPNIVGMLWLRDEEYVHVHPAFQTVLASRSIFSSRKAAQSFIGYAEGQFKKMEAFDIERMREYEDLTAQITCWKLDLQAVLNKHPDKMEELVKQFDRWPRKDRAFNFGWLYDDHYTSKEAADLLRKFRKLHTQYFSGYMGEKRKKMVREFGYDVKNASHLIRLLRMGKEFLETGVLRVHRTEDAEELIGIKQGRWTLEEVKREANRLFAEVRTQEDLCTLPEEPDFESANWLLERVQQAMLSPSSPYGTIDLSVF
jgi:predicted nucleotidyltransferase